MNENRLKKIVEAVRNEIPPAPPADFDRRVLRAVSHDFAVAGRASTSLFDQLNLLFPRLAVAAVLIIGICVAGDFVLTAMHLPGLSDGAAQISDQWLFSANCI